MAAMKRMAEFIEENLDEDLLEQVEESELTETYDFLDGMHGVDSYHRGINVGRAEMARELKEMLS